MEPNEKMIVKRWKLASELLTTENTYVNNIKLLMDVFYKPMFEHVKNVEEPKRLMTMEDVKQIFGSIKVIQGLNTQLLQFLNDRMNVSEEEQPSVMIGDIFKNFADYFKTYTTYCHDYEQSLETLKRCRENPDFETFFMGLHDKKIIGEQSIKQFLILPVQRIPRYKMLLHEMVKNTWETHPDYNNLVEALEQISKIAQFVEDAQDRYENIKKIVEIQSSLRSNNNKKHDIKLLQPNRIYLTEIMLDVIDTSIDGNIKNRKIFLFNDIFLICKFDPKKKKEPYQVSRLAEFTTVSCVAKSFSENRHTLMITVPGATLTLFFDTEQKRDDWHEHLQNCMKAITFSKLQPNISPPSVPSPAPSPLKKSKLSKKKKHNTVGSEEVQVINPLKSLQKTATLGGSAGNNNNNAINAAMKRLSNIPPLPSGDEIKKSSSMDALNDMEDPKTRKNRSKTLFSPRSASTTHNVTE